MAQQDLSSFDFSQNPFSDVLSGMGGSQPGQQMGGQMPPMMPQGQTQQPQPQGGGAEGTPGTANMPEDQLVRGSNPGNTRFLLGAVQQLENFVKQSTDRNEILTVRGIITLLSQLISNDQKNMAGKLQQ